MCSCVQDRSQAHKRARAAIDTSGPDTNGPHRETFRRRIIEPFKELKGLYEAIHKAENQSLKAELKQTFEAEIGLQRIGFEKRLFKALFEETPRIECHQCREHKQPSAVLHVTLQDDGDRFFTAVRVSKPCTVRTLLAPHAWCHKPPRNPPYSLAPHCCQSAAHASPNLND